MDKIFVTAIGGDIGYGVIKALKQSKRDMYIIGCDTQKYNYSYDMVDEFYVAPSYNYESIWIEFVLDILKNNKIKYFWPITEKEIQIINNYRDLFKDYKVFINSKNILDIALDKEKTAIFLSKAGIDTPDTWNSIDEYTENYPVIVKERFSCGSHGVYVANNRKEVVTSFNNMKKPVIQEYIGDSDDEYTMTIFSDGNVINSIMFKRILGFGGLSRYVELVHDSKTTDLACSIARCFNLRGSVNVQMRKRNSELCVFEINPRISSTIGFRVQLGFNDVSWWFDLFDGKEIEQYIVPKEAVYGVRGVEEKIFMI